MRRREVNRCRGRGAGEADKLRSKADQAVEAADRTGQALDASIKRAMEKVAAVKLEHPIPFIRKFPPSRVHPTGKTGLVEIDRGPEMEAKASEVIARGGRFMIAILENDMVALACAAPAGNGEVRELAAESVPNGPLLLGAVDRLVTRSLDAMSAVE